MLYLRVMHTRARLAVLVGILAVPATIQACVGDSPATHEGSVDSGTGDTTSPGDGGHGGDGGSCTPGCVADASTFRDCDGGSPVDTACSFRCVSAPSAHCGVFNPPGAVEPADFTTTNLDDVSLCAADAGPNTCFYVFHTDTGQIEGASALRPGNANPTSLEVGNGIGFRIASYDAGTDKVAIFSFKSLHLLGGKIDFVGPNPVAFVATNDIEIRGLVDVGDTSYGCQAVAAAGGGARGAAGAASQSVGGGGGGSGATNDYPGGGGGGSAGNGGAGGDVGITNQGGAAGPAFNEGFNPLRGGGGGGGGGNTSNVAIGGVGGGALALFANGTITIAPGGGSSWGINAGGCPAYPSGGGSNGGAGAGGAILVEGHDVVEVGPAGLAANGASGGSYALGVRGSLSANPAPGTAAYSYAGVSYGAGGNGGAGTTPATAGQNLGGAGFTTYYPGGGGGGIGRIGIGSYGPVQGGDGGFILSPPPTTMPLPIE